MSMADTKIIHSLGPFDVDDVDDDILGDVVYNQGLPIIVKQNVNNNTKFAVVAKDRELRIVCGGCFTRNMSLADDSRCKKVCSFVKHWDNKKGERCQTCKNSGDESIETKAEFAKTVVLDSTGASTGTSDGLRASDEEIFAEVERRKLEKHIAERMTEDGLVEVMIAMGICPLFDARQTRLIHELRRQAKGVSIQEYYHEDKKIGHPHCTDEVGADIVEKDGVTHFEPRSVTDYR